MNYIDKFRDKSIVDKYLFAIKQISKQSVTLMEVCGGHTMSIHKFGIPSLLPDNIRLLSGPGCPVCVTGREFIDKAVAYSRLNDIIITTYGDLIRVPGSSSSLEKEKADGADVRIIYSVLNALEIAKENPAKKVIFLGVGFETTSPGTAIAILNADKEKISNFYLLSSHKIMPPALRALVNEDVKIDGFIAPGHVGTITGSDIYNEIPENYGKACVVSGFEPVDILQSIFMLIKQIENRAPKVEIQYSRAVTPEGNIIAQNALDTVFGLKDDWWRGLGILKDSGYKLRDKYSRFDAEMNISAEFEETIEPKGCICGDVLKGLTSPLGCKLFSKVCTPMNPVGTCMVSNEGACHAFYKYAEH